MTRFHSIALACVLALVPTAARATNLTISLQSEEGLFVVAENGGNTVVRANRTQRGPWETFTLFDLNAGQLLHGDRVVLRAVDGHFVTAENGGGQELEANRTFAVSWETFVIERVDGSTTNAIDDHTSIRLKAVNNAYVAAIGGNLDASNQGFNRFMLSVVGRFAPTPLSAPFANPPDFVGPIGVDHDAVKRNQWECSGFFGQNFPNCYDGHTGSDFMLRGWFPGMILLENDVIAAAGGLVVDLGEGNGDKCFAAPNPGGQYQIQCPGNPGLNPNFVTVLQDDGDVATYFHLKRDTVAVQIGQRVECGQKLGEVGSSGISSAPHLHFELNRNNMVVDPYSLSAWASLSGRIPQRTCNVPPAPVCTAIKTVFDCSTQPAQSICEGLQLVSGGTCVVPGFNGCLETCNDLCQQVNQVITIPCP